MFRIDMFRTYCFLLSLSLVFWTSSACKKDYSLASPPTSTASSSSSLPRVASLPASPPKERSPRREGLSLRRRHSTGSLSSALTSFDDICTSSFRSKPLLVFLDYDGTLSPVQLELKGDHGLSPAMSSTMKELEKNYVVSLITGRELKNIKEIMPLKTSYYAGSNGFDIEGPDGHKQIAKRYVPLIDRFCDEMNKRLEHLPAAEVIKVNCWAMIKCLDALTEEEKIEVHHHVIEVQKNFDDLTVTSRNQVYHINPRMDWNKGKAIDYLLSEFEQNIDDYSTLYIGDGLADEAAFKYLNARNRDNRNQENVSILVTQKPLETNAMYTVKNTEEVQQFLKKIIDYGKKKQPEILSRRRILWN